MPDQSPTPAKLKLTKPRERASRYSTDGRYARNIPAVRTVGELKALLAALPDALPLNLMDDGYKPVWFNVGHDDEHFTLEDNDGTFDD